ncbi:MAG: hypothetical protein AB7S56_09260, partial [Halothiobacillaceae bacterium]
EPPLRDIHVAKGLNAPSMALLPGFCRLRHSGIKRGDENQIQIRAFGASVQQPLKKLTKKPAKRRVVTLS